MEYDNLYPAQFNGKIAREFCPVVGKTFVDINGTVKGNRYRDYGEFVYGPMLMVRAEKSPYHCFPYCLGGEVFEVDGVTITLIDSVEAGHFLNNDTVTYYDYSAGCFVTHTAIVNSVDTTAQQVVLKSALTGLEAGDLLFLYKTDTDGVVGPKVDDDTADQNTVVNCGEIFIKRDQILPIKIYISGCFIDKYVCRRIYMPSSKAGAKTLYGGSNKHLTFV